MRRAFILPLLLVLSGSCDGPIEDVLEHGKVRFETVYCHPHQDPYEWSASWDVYLYPHGEERVDPTTLPGLAVVVWVRKHRFLQGGSDIPDDWVRWPSVGGNRYVIDGVNGGKSGGEYWRWEMVTTIGTTEEPQKYVSRVVWLPDHLGCTANP